MEWDEQRDEMESKCYDEHFTFKECTFESMEWLKNKIKYFDALFGTILAMTKE